MDFVLAMLPWKLLLSMRMRKREKLGIIIAMSMGILYVYHPSCAILSFLSTII